jgi:hypothetical protein
MLTTSPSIGADACGKTQKKKQKQDVGAWRRRSLEGFFF